MIAMTWRCLARAFAVWTGVGVVCVLNELLYRLAVADPRPYGGPWETASSVWLWAAMTPSIVALARRFPLDRGRVAGRVALHALAGLTCCLLDVVVDRLLAGGTGARLAPSLAAEFLAQLVINLFSYGGVVAVAYAASYRGLYNERRTRDGELEAELARAQLRALEMQLRPHFLFNTLHGIGGLIRTRESGKAIRMLAGLGELLRTTLARDGRQEVPLRDELALLDRYLAIEQVRFGDRLRVVVDVDASALDVAVPSLILQPLVENAVQHGVSDDRGGQVEIHGCLDGDWLRLRVCDSGRAAASAAGHDGEGVGLSNTRARLGHLYGTRQRLDLSSRPTGGTEALLVIPRQREAMAVP